MAVGSDSLVVCVEMRSSKFSTMPTSHNVLHVPARQSRNGLTSLMGLVLDPIDLRRQLLDRVG